MRQDHWRGRRSVKCKQVEGKALAPLLFRVGCRASKSSSDATFLAVLPLRAHDTSKRRLAAGVLDETNPETDAKRDNDNDEHNDEEAPPLELATVAGVLVGDLDLLVALLNVLDRVDSVLLGGVDDGFLLLDEDSHLLEQLGDLGERALDALKLAVTGADVAEDGVGLAQAVVLQLQRVVSITCEVEGRGDREGGRDIPLSGKHPHFPSRPRWPRGPLLPWHPG